LEARQKAYWAEVMERLDRAWSEVIGGSPTSPIKGVARAASGDSGRASVSERTSAEFTSRQPEAPTDQARPSEATAAMVEPQVNQRSEGEGIATSTADMERLGDPVKAQEFERVIRELGDVEILLDDGTRRSARELIDEARADARAAAELEACIGAAAEAAT
jgi:hypothetical protein